jgi:F-type H+-transporting ATPase subunit a
MNIFALSFEKMLCRMQKINKLRRFFPITLVVISLLFVKSGFANTAEPAGAESKMTAVNEKFNAGDMIIEHILDSHDWHLWGSGHTAVAIPLPIIVFSAQRGINIFMSSHFHHGQSTYKGYMLHKFPGEKKPSIVAVTDMHALHPEKATIDENLTASLWDLSITKNVMAIMISGFLLVFIMTSVAKSYKKREGMAPKGLQSLIEPLIILIRDDVAKPSIGKKYEKFMPYLLTVFFFVLLNNLMGLIPFFPAGANLTGNIAITLSLALITFIIQLFNTNKNFWQHVFAMPGIPKAVLIILTPIEILSVILRPFVLMVRLFANITAGHIVALAFISMIFIFKETFGLGGAYGISIFSGLMYIFMGFLELLVAFLQAYVFTLLSAIYFGAAVEEHHHDTPGHDAHVEEAALI